MWRSDLATYNESVVDDCVLLVMYTIEFVRGICVMYPLKDITISTIERTS